MHSCTHSRHLQKPSGSQSCGKRPAAVTPQKELILGVAEQSFRAVIQQIFVFSPSYFKNLSCVFPFEPLGHQLFPPCESSFCLQFYLSCLPISFLYTYTQLIYRWTIFLAVFVKVTELNHTSTMPNQNDWGHMYILQQHYCSINILLPLSMLPHHAVQSIMPAAIRSNSYNRVRSPQAQR